MPALHYFSGKPCEEHATDVQAVHLFIVAPSKLIVKHAVNFSRERSFFRLSSPLLSRAASLSGFLPARIPLEIPTKGVTPAASILV